MIRTVINLIATCTVGLVILAVGIGLYNHAVSGIDAIPGLAWNHRGAMATATAVPTYVPGVDVIGALPTAAATPTTAVAPPAPPNTDPAHDLAAECAWAVSTLREDAQLDQAGAAGQWTSYYRTSAGHWTTIAKWIGTNCVPGRGWGHQTCTDSLGWLDGARISHVADEAKAAPEATRQWNDTWIANYERLTALVTELCR